jgi:two-component system NtrC family sensor kinase
MDKKTNEELTCIRLELEQQKAFVEGVLNKAAVPMFVLDVNHRIIVWNNAIENLTGLKAEDMLGTNRQWLAFYASERPVLADLILSDDEADLEKLYSTYRMSQHVSGGIQSEGWLENVGGQRRYLFFDAAPIFDANDRKLGVIESLLDISDRKLSEVELAASKEALQDQHRQLSKIFSQVEKAKREWESTLDCTSDMVLMCDTFGKIKRCNRPITELTGLEYDKIVGKNWMTLLVGFGIQVVDFDGKRGKLFDPNSQRHFEMNVSPIRQPDRGL